MISPQGWAVLSWCAERKFVGEFLLSQWWGAGVKIEFLRFLHHKVSPLLSDLGKGETLL